jgi:hypothetical protein
MQAFREEDARRTVKLADDNALGSVNNEVPRSVIIGKLPRKTSCSMVSTKSSVPSAAFFEERRRRAFSGTL